MEHCVSDYYADDVAVHTHGKAQNEIESKLQQDSNNTKLWCKQNKMETRTHSMARHRKSPRSRRNLMVIDPLTPSQGH